ncbi:MAG: AbrB/MazE/SpoVT family DNA-binding domain-containing protein [Candidatus Bathyarchaeia archaeon]
MRIRRRIGQKGQIVIPKDIREYVGIMPGDEVVMEVREKEVVIRSGVDPKDFVESFCRVAGKKLTKKIDLEGLLEQEAEERFALH